MSVDVLMFGLSTVGGGRDSGSGVGNEVSDSNASGGALGGERLRNIGFFDSGSGSRIVGAVVVAAAAAAAEAGVAMAGTVAIAMPAAVAPTLEAIVEVAWAVMVAVE